MTDPSNSPILTDKQKAEIYNVLWVGCDRQTAADMVGCSLADFRGLMQSDPEFGAEVRRTEASCEFTHMCLVHKAANEDKQWRASLWWLECRAPERYAPRGPGVVAKKHLELFIARIAEGIKTEVHDSADRQRVADGLHRRAAELNDLLHDRSSLWSETESSTARLDRSEPESESGEAESPRSDAPASSHEDH